MKIVLALFFFLSGFLLFSSSVQAATYTVCASGCDATTIGTALTMVDSMTGGDQIQVESTYNPGGETYPLNFPDASTTLACDPGAMIGQTNPTAISGIFLSTSSTVRDCTFGQVELTTKSVGMSSLEPAGIRIENNLFSNSATSSIYFYAGGTDFVIQGNRNINYLTFEPAHIVDNGLVQNNTFYGRMGSGFSAYMLSLTASTTNLSFFNNDFVSYATSVGGANAAINIEGENIVFATSTLKYMVFAPAGVTYAVTLTASGTNYFGGNKIQAPLGNDNCTVVSVYPTIGSTGVQMSYKIYQNTIFLKCGGASASALQVYDAGELATINVTTTNNIFWGANGARAMNVQRSNMSSSINFYNDWNGFYQFHDALQTAGGVSAALGSSSFYRDPIFMVDDLSDTNNFDVAPFSFYLNAYGQRIGATTSTRRYTVNIAQGETIDYDAVDATTTSSIPEYISSSMDITIAPGTYPSFTVQDTAIMEHVSIRGAGTGTVIDAQGRANGIVFSAVTSSNIGYLTVQNGAADGSSYSITKTVYNKGGIGYGDAIDDFDLPATSSLLLVGGGSCEIEPYDDGQDVSDLVNASVANWHIALVTIGGSFHETIVVPGHLANSQAAFEADCLGGDLITSVDGFITNAFVRSGSNFSYSAAAVSGAGATLDASLPTPAISLGTSGYAGMKFVNSRGIEVTAVTSTNNLYGFWFSDADSYGNTVSSSIMTANVGYDIRDQADRRNTLKNTSFTRASTTVTGAGDLLVMFEACVHTQKYADDTSLSGATVTATDDASNATSLGTTPITGDTPYVLLPAYTITSVSNEVTNGGYNPYQFSATASGYNASSTFVNVTTTNQTIRLAMISTAPLSAPSSATPTTIGTTTSTLTWADNSDEETAFRIEYMSPAAGESFPGTVVHAARNATSLMISGLTPGQTYRFRVAAENINGTSTYATSPLFTLLPVAPLAPTLASVSETSVSVQVNASTNATSTTYAIYDVTDGRYVDATGILTGSAVWQATTTWGTRIVTGLTCGTSYTFVTIAQNISAITSATSSSASVSTTACPSAGGGGGGGGSGGGSGGGASAPVASPRTVFDTGSQTTTTLPLPTASSSVSVIPAPTPAIPVVTTTVAGLPDLTNREALLVFLGLASDEAAEARALDFVRADAREFSIALSSIQTRRLVLFITYGVSTETRRLGEGERRALIRDMLETMRSPDLQADDMQRLTIGQIPRMRNLVVERQQLVRVRQTFRTLYAHDPNFQDNEENMAWNVLMYRIRFPRNLTEEQEGIRGFRTVFGRVPATPFQWATVRVMGYIQE